MYWLESPADKLSCYSRKCNTNCRTVSYTHDALGRPYVGQFLNFLQGGQDFLRWRGQQTGIFVLPPRVIMSHLSVFFFFSRDIQFRWNPQLSRDQVSTDTVKPAPFWVIPKNISKVLWTAYAFLWLESVWGQMSDIYTRSLFLGGSKAFSLAVGWTGRLTVTWFMLLCQALHKSQRNLYKDTRRANLRVRRASSEGNVIAGLLGGDIRLRKEWSSP